MLEQPDAGYPGTMKARLRLCRGASLVGGRNRDGLTTLQLHPRVGQTLPTLCGVIVLVGMS